MRGKKLMQGLMGLMISAIMNITLVPAQATSFAEIERGRYLSRVGDCIACHTAEGGQPFTGGRPIPTPFGVIYSTNITPDQETGIGAWTGEDFYNAMHEGVDDEGHHLYPAFPYPWFTRVSRTDVQAIRTFLLTIDPIRQKNKPTQFIWPLNWRPLMAVWNTFYFHAGDFQPDPAKSDKWNRGAYIVETLGHCGACHSPKNALGAVKGEGRLRGGDSGEHWYAPSLANNLREGVGGWSAAEIIEYLKTGSNVKAAAVGPMAEVVKNSTQYLSNADLDAVATYLKEAPEETGQNTKTIEIDKQVLTRGEALYADQCTGCHMHDGGGLTQVFPPLKGNAAVQAEHPDTVIHMILTGSRMAATESKPTGLAMPAFDWKLDDNEIADLASYIRNAWGNHASLVSAASVAEARKDIAHSAAN